MTTVAALLQALLLLIAVALAAIGFAQEDVVAMLGAIFTLALSREELR